jgi:acetylornithine/succinyldiaminopimelate/putrescine aminotransferase
LKNKCQERGALLIVDEIQTGMGRTGSLWNFEQAGIVPDVLLLAKAFGGGLPLGAFIADPSIMRVLSENPSLGHLTTFGGNALSCVASLAALTFIIENDLADHAKKIGTLIKETLSTHAAIREVRGEGLLMAVDLHNPDHMTKAIAACREEGLLVDWFLFNNRSLRLAPPLIISEEEALLLCSKMRNALDTL